MQAIRFYILIKIAQLLNPKWLKLDAKVILAQAIHETGNFGSKIFNENKNLFGMKDAKVRKETSLGDKNGYANYKSYYSCIRDYFMRQESFNLLNIKDAKEYMIATVKSGYAGDSNYLSKWEGVYNKFKDDIQKANYVWVALVPGFLVILYMVLRWAYFKLFKKGGK